MEDERLLRIIKELQRSLDRLETKIDKINDEFPQENTDFSFEDIHPGSSDKAREKFDLEKGGKNEK